MKRKLVIGFALLAGLSSGGYLLAQNIAQRPEYINGILVPPLPEKSENNKTLHGLDTDNNGVRDDIDRLLAEKFGRNPKQHHHAMQYTQAVQRLMKSSSSEDKKLVSELLPCLDSDTLHRLNIIDQALINTKERGKAYASALAGIVVGDCKNSSASPLLQ